MRKESLKKIEKYVLKNGSTTRMFHPTLEESEYLSKKGISVTKTVVKLPSILFYDSYVLYDYFTYALD